MRAAKQAQQKASPWPAPVPPAAVPDAPGEAQHKQQSIPDMAGFAAQCAQLFGQSDRAGKLERMFLDADAKHAQEAREAN